MPASQSIRAQSPGGSPSNILGTKGRDRALSTERSALTVPPFRSEKAKAERPFWNCAKPQLASQWTTKCV